MTIPLEYLPQSVPDEIMPSDAEIAAIVKDVDKLIEDNFHMSFEEFATRTLLQQIKEADEAAERRFKDCTALTFASFKSVSVLPAPNASNVQFVGCEALAAIHFAAENEEAIKATTGWARSEGSLGAANATIYFDL